jgi:hypothetical protein
MVAVLSSVDNDTHEHLSSLFVDVVVIGRRLVHISWNFKSVIDRKEKRYYCVPA